MENTAKRRRAGNGRRVLDVGKGQPEPLPSPAMRKRLGCRGDAGNKETTANPEKTRHWGFISQGRRDRTRRPGEGSATSTGVDGEHQIPGNVSLLCELHVAAHPVTHTCMEARTDRQTDSSRRKGRHSPCLRDRVLAPTDIVRSTRYTEVHELLSVLLVRSQCLKGKAAPNTSRHQRLCLPTSPAHRTLTPSRAAMSLLPASLSFSLPCAPPDPGSFLLS